MNNDEYVHKHIATGDKRAFVSVREILPQRFLISCRSHAVGTQPPPVGCDVGGVERSLAETGDKEQ